MKKYENFCRNLEVLSRADKEDFTNEFIMGGIIDKFNIQFELSWKLFKEILRYEGSSVAASGSPREIIKEAYRIWNFIDEEIWLKMLRSRNDMSHLYDGGKAKAMVQIIIGEYIPEFIKVKDAINAEYGDNFLRS